MAIRPEDRFPSAEAFESAIREAARDVGIGAGVPSSPRQPDLRDSVPIPRATVARPAAIAATERGESSFFGREADLEWFRRSLGAANGRSWLEITGRPGVGKTEMLRAAGRFVESLGLTHVAVAAEPPPYHELSYRGLRRIIPRLAGLPVVEITREVGLGAIDKSALEGLRVVFQGSTPRSSHPDGTRRAAAAAFAWAAKCATERASSRRVALFLDDVDRMDLASLNALKDQHEEGGVAGLSIVSTSERALDSASSRRGVRKLAGISRADAIRMLGPRDSDPWISPSDDEIEPLYMAQARLVKSAPGRALPPTLAGLVEWRVQGLSALQRKILQVVAIVGVTSEGELGRLMGVPSAEKTGSNRPVVSNLIDAGFLAIRDDRVMLAHQIIGRVAIAGAPGGALAEVHARAADMLTAPSWLELRAHHAIRGNADFAAFLDIEVIAEMRHRYGDTEGAIAALSQTVAAARIHILRGDRATGAAALDVFGRKLAAAYINEERFGEAREALLDILTVCEPADSGRLAVLEQLAAVGHLEGDAEEARAKWTEAVEVAIRCGDANAVERLRALLAAGAMPESRRAGKESEPNAGRRSVLVVDDDRSIRETILSILASDGRKAIGAANGKEALEVLRRIPKPGLILLDLMMPVMSGWELLERLRSDERTADVPVVVVSAVGKRNERGASRVIQKPVQAGTLLNLVAEFCE
jgi:CheY-like chemotaxis protein